MLTPNIPGLAILQNKTFLSLTATYSKSPCIVALNNGVSKTPIRRSEREGKVLFSTIAKPGMFWLAIASKENFLAYSTRFIFLIIKLVPRNEVMVTIDICGKSPITGEWIYEIT